MNLIVNNSNVADFSKAKEKVDQEAKDKEQLLRGSYRFLLETIQETKLSMEMGVMGMSAQLGVSPEEYTIGFTIYVIDRAECELKYLVALRNTTSNYADVTPLTEHINFLESKLGVMRTELEDVKRALN